MIWNITVEVIHDVIDLLPFHNPCGEQKHNNKERTCSEKCSEETKPALNKKKKNPGWWCTTITPKGLNQAQDQRVNVTMLPTTDSSHLKDQGQPSDKEQIWHKINRTKKIHR